jgi:hypothetical protein
MSPSDFVPREYVSPDGSMRVYRDGVLWYADVLEAGRWKPVARHHLSSEVAMIACLASLDLLTFDEHEPDSTPDLDWWE